MMLITGDTLRLSPRHYRGRISRVLWYRSWNDYSIWFIWSELY